MKTLLLIDGSSYLYRAFHAMPDLRSPDGAPTGAVYGMINMLRRLEREVAADYSACIFDAKGKTFRDDLYPAYKAHRPPMPDDLRQQIAPVHAAVRALGWPLLMVDGVEADDVIGTLAKNAAAAGFQVVISTGDKDMAQLVTPQVKLVNTMTEEWLDEAGVAGKFGVPPARIIDYLTLTGDKVDNVPGVDKCGPKTAVKWLENYGDLDTLMAQANEVGGKVGENLRTALAWLPLSRQLVTIKTDVDLATELPQGFDSLLRPAVDRPAMSVLCRELGFRTWLKEYGDGTALTEPVAPARPEAIADDLFAAAPVADATPTAPAAASPALVTPTAEARYQTVLTEAALADWLARLATAPRAAFDTETDSLDPMQARIVGVSFAVTPGEAAYVPLAHVDPGVETQLDRDRVLAQLKPWLENPAAAKVLQNANYDRHVLANHGIRLAGVADDTMLMDYVLASHERHNMDAMAERELGLATIKYEDICGKGARQIGFAEVDLDTATRYAAEDADVTLRLRDALAGKLDGARDTLYRSIELPTAAVLFAMERTGVLIDRAELARQSQVLGEEMLAIEAEVYELAGQPFNLNSPKQLSDILFNKLAIDTKGVKKTASGGYSTDESVLEKLAEDYPLPKALLRYRGLAKLKSTYTDKLPAMINPDTGRVHTHYSQASVVTGRLASSDPNLQNIPIRTDEGRRVREAFVAPAGSCIVSADYSQIELRIMAHLSGDAGLIAAFREGRDIHRATASEVFGVPLEAVSAEQRRYAKTINFGLIYGMSAFGLAKSLEIDNKAAQTFIERYFARYPGVQDYMQRTREAAREQGWVETVFGRRLYLPEIRSSNAARRAGAERAAINAPMQGTAADLIKLAMIRVADWLQREQLASRLIMQVHDELVLEVPEAERERVCAALPQEMAAVAGLAVPLVAEVGSGANWGTAH
ncbi:DNA polymerase I [Laribacter hongkongensis]|uniref:DNA polymerase I n=1 Tax=Laribacter hongkongensis TaxID=168471 RepID=UPI001EFE50EE|nr:DNA polymerase I [Laribacter hongkongensis]MCG9079622.1 DNA polymerase I [Laribacter hongkongensis]